MTVDVSVDSSSDLKKCSACGLDVPRQARLCHHCGSHQDWRRHLSLSNTALALLVALISVLSTAVPPAFRWLNTKSKTHLSLASVDQKTLRFVATNDGFYPSMIEGADVDLPQLPPASGLELIGGNAIILNGNRQVDLKIRTGLSGSQAYDSSIKIASDAMSINPKVQGFVVIKVRESDRTLTVFRYPVTTDTVFLLLRKHADECDDAPKPTFTNDCVGGGEKDERQPG